MTVLERIDPDTTRTLRAAGIRCQCGRYLYPSRGPRRYAEGVCSECAGTRGPWHDGTNVVEDAEFLAEHGHNLAGAAQQLGYRNALALERALYRHGRTDLLRRLRRPR